MKTFISVYHRISKDIINILCMGLLFLIWISVSKAQASQNDIDSKSQLEKHQILSEKSIRSSN